MLVGLSLTELPEDEEEKESATKRAISRIRARLISQDRLSRDSYGSSFPPSELQDDDQDFPEMFDKGDLDDNSLVGQDSLVQGKLEEGEKHGENRGPEENGDVIHTDRDGDVSKSDNDEGGIDNLAFE